MRRTSSVIALLATSLALALWAAVGCSRPAERTVVVYTSLDAIFSQPILDDFRLRTGIRVLPVYDTESAKTTGLVTRLIAEKSRPRADVFWNSEVAQTLVLKEKQILAPYASPFAAAIPAEWKDPQNYWTGFAARARVLIYNIDLVQDPPQSVRDLLRPEWAGKIAIAQPLFGTTLTHTAAWFALWGDAAAKEFLLALKANRVAVLPGNADVRDMVARGEYAVGLTDTDDANGAVADGQPVKWILPDQEVGGIGTLVVPNTVALVAGAPHAAEGRALIDYLLSPEVEKRLAESAAIQVPLNPAVVTDVRALNIADIHAMAVTPERIAAKMAGAAAFVREEFAQ